MFPPVIDSSMLAEYKQCPAKFFLGSIQHWKPREPSVHLHAGASFAKGVEVARRAFYEQGQDAEVSVAEGLKALLQHYGDFQCPEDSAKSALRMAGALEFYFDRYPLTHNTAYPVTLPGGRKGIEFSFTHELPITHPDSGEPLQICGRMDGIFHYAGGIFIIDEKTTSSLGATWSQQWNLRGQFTGYAWGAKESGMRVDGAVIRGVSILKTKYDTQEAITYRSETAIARWYTEMLEWVQEMITAYKRRVWKHNLDHSCADFGGCGFRRVCDSDSEESRQSQLETNFARRAWDPVTRVETVLDSPA